MIRDDGRRVVSVDLGPELYSQICQVHALFGVGKTEFMRASVRIMMSLIATVSKAGGITQREATRAVLESMPPITGVDIEDIRATCLSYAGTFMTGSPTDPERTRHTRFWRLDYDYIRGLGGCE